MAHDYMHELGFHNMISNGGNGMTIENTIMMGDSGNDMKHSRVLVKQLRWGMRQKKLRI